MAALLCWLCVVLSLRVEIVVASRRTSGDVTPGPLKYHSGRLGFITIREMWPDLFALADDMRKRPISRTQLRRLAALMAHAHQEWERRENIRIAREEAAWRATCEARFAQVVKAHRLVATRRHAMGQSSSRCGCRPRTSHRSRRTSSARSSSRSDDPGGGESEPPLGGSRGPLVRRRPGWWGR